MLDGLTSPCSRRWACRCASARAASRRAASRKRHVSGAGGSAQSRAKRRVLAAAECGISRSSSVPPRQRGKMRHGACAGSRL
eukprot:scaffold43973_cov59-Phaeocystis_antarctica.AAC.2